jgi:hypothetical protein
MASKGLAAFEVFGVKVLRLLDEGKEAECRCPTCLKPKLYIQTQRMVWHCKVCGSSGNHSQFLAHVAKEASATIAPDLLMRLAKDRGGLKTSTLRMFDVGWRSEKYTYPSLLPPSNGVAGWSVADLRQYQIGLIPRSAPGAHLGLIAPKTFGDVLGSRGGESGTVWLCEGEWDTFAWWQILHDAGVKDDALGVCGAGNFPKKALEWFLGKEVVLLFDNDVAGQSGAARTWALLQAAGAKCKRLAWPAEGEALPEGYDIRDLCMALKWQAKMVVAKVRAMLTDQPPAGAKEVAQRVKTAAEVAAKEVDPKGKGLTPTAVERRFKRWLELPGTECLDVLFGAVMANRLDVDPLWMFIVAPSGSLKSELLMSLDGAPCVHCITTLSPHALISGMNFGGEDPSLIPQIIGRTLVVKDFTTILSLNQMTRDEIFGTLRDAYDGKTAKKFGHVLREYEGRFGLLGGVTGVIDSITHQASILGERFIKYRIPVSKGITRGSAAILRALDNLTEESAMRDDLRACAAVVLNRPISAKNAPRLPLWFKERVAELGQLVALLRGAVGREKYSGVVTHVPSHESGTRLAKQFATLSLGIGVYRQVEELDEEIYAVVSRVARDTIPDRVELVVRVMYVHGGQGTTEEVAAWGNLPLSTVRFLLQDLTLLGATRKADGDKWALDGGVMAYLKKSALYAAEKAWAQAK